ncbi:MAG: CIA30 family protein, partial [Ignavibacteria bacterium]|nr:CIA30 family protein [Ignavibacteria bacterium]
QDVGEVGIPNVLVKLFDCSDNLLDSTYTDGNGKYLFSNLQPGNYYVKFFAPDSLKFTLKDQGSNDMIDSDADELTGKSSCISLTPGENNLTVDAGLVYKRGSIGDFVWNDLDMDGIQDPNEPGLENIIVKLYDCAGNFIAQTVTDSLGKYSFTNLLPGSYKIEVVLPNGYQFSPKDQGSDNSKDSDINSSNSQSDCITLNPGENYADLDAGMHLIPPPPVCSIGDRVWFDTNKNGIQDASETGVANVLIKLFDCNGNLKDSTYTDNDGYYSFDSLVAGQYKIKVIIPSGFTFSPKDVGSNDLLDSDVDPSTGETSCINIDPQNCGENDVKWDAGIYPTPPAPTCAIGDRVWEDLNKNGIQDIGEPGVPYVTVKLLDCNGQVINQTQTNSNGYYQFTNILEGSYKLRFVLPNGYAFTLKDAGSNDLLDSDVDPITGMTICFPIEPPYCDSNANKWDAGIYKIKGSIGDFVWFDANGNGIQDAGETGLAGITVKLYDCSDNLISTTTTNSQGKYKFEDLMPGNYYVKFMAPTGYLFTIKDAGSDDTKDSDADPLTGKTVCFTLAAGQNDMTWDAGLSECVVGYKVCGVVFNDVNGNGILDFGEVGIENVVVKLWGTSANLIAQTITDALGRFEFLNVPDGEYHVQEIDPYGYISTTPNSFNIFVNGQDVCGIKFGDKVKPTPEPCDLTKYKTYTQDQWCLEPAKSLLENNFATVFPTGFEIGGEGAPYKAIFTNVNSLKAFLPQIGNVGQFSTNYVNPATTSAGEFAGNVAALKLNVAFNDAGLLGSASTTKIKNLVVASGPLKDYKVSEVLLLANIALGGGTTPFTIQVLNEAVKMINYNFACDCNYGFLTCPTLPDTSSGGFDAGVESNANLADLLLKRLTKIEYGMTTKILRNPKIAFTASVGLYELLPQFGPMGSVPREATPFDILGISNATSAYAVDYNLPLAKGEARIAGVFATTTNPPYIYEHTKAICDRLINAELKSLTQIKIGENYYFASVIDKVEEGYIDYTIQFSVYEKGNTFIVDSRWLIEDYQVPSGVTNIYNFQVWGSNFKNAAFLVNQIIEQFKQRGNVEFMNRAQMPQLMTYVTKGRYLHNGSVEMVIKNENTTPDNIRVIVRSRATQGGEKFEQVHTYSLNPGLNSISLKTGILSDANIYIISSNGFKDEIFVSGGAFTFLNGQNSTVDNFDTKSYPAQNLKDYPEGSLVLSGGVRMQGRLNDWVTIFRSLTANTAPIDLSDYEAVRFTIKGNGIVWLRIEQDGVQNFNFHMKRIVLDGTEQTLTIPFNEFVQREGTTMPLDPSKIRKISLVYEKRDNMNLVNYDVELKNIAFLSKNGSKKSGENEIPKEYKLTQNYPNPFNPATMIEFSIVKPEFVSLKVYNILGQEVATLVNEVKNPGTYSVRFDASNLSSGVYIYRLQTDSYSATKKMILQK